MAYKTYRVEMEFTELWQALNALSRQRLLFEVRGLRPDADDVMRHTCEAEDKLRAILFPITPDTAGWSEGELREAYGR